jgi:hypothetical protein
MFGFGALEYGLLIAFFAGAFAGFFFAQIPYDNIADHEKEAETPVNHWKDTAVKDYYDRQLKIKEGVKNNKIIPMFKRWK